MKIAIIGGGFGGLLASYILQKKGHEITLYEKENILGGHCQTLNINNATIELGTVFLLKDQIKNLLIELKIDYQEKFSYRAFIDNDHKTIEQISENQITLLKEEIIRLKLIFNSFPSLNKIDYDYIDPELTISLKSFLINNNFKIIDKIIIPYLSAFGFGNYENLPAYYAFKILDLDLLFSFINDEKLLFLPKGLDDLISKLAISLKDIRINTKIVKIKINNNKVIVKTKYDEETYDKVLLTCCLDPTIIKSTNHFKIMNELTTNDYFTCIFKVKNNNLLTSYFKDNLGKMQKLQFFYANKKNLIISTYAYGKLDQKTFFDIKNELEASNIIIDHLITTKTWNIFPHLKTIKNNETFYLEIKKLNEYSPINFIGSLITKPSINYIYLSITDYINKNNF